MRFWRVLALVTCLVAPMVAGAMQLGKVGPTYSVGEPSFLDFIQQRLREKEQSGELRKLQEEAERRAIQTVNNPPPVAGIATAAVAKTFYFDPTFTLDRNVFDAKGRLLFPVGTKANPLNVVALPVVLLFFDARDGRQVEQAKALIDQYQGKVKPILVGGSYMDLMKRWRRQVYYDQGGVLTRKLGIQRVPALVSQEGLRLRIDELVVATR
jgi:conjugal transfer pilus assembly protein TraW